jgi:hypothetical protein
MASRVGISSSLVVNGSASGVRAAFQDLNMFPESFVLFQPGLAHATRDVDELEQEKRKPGDMEISSGSLGAPRTHPCQCRSEDGEHASVASRQRGEGNWKAAARLLMRSFRVHCSIMRRAGCPKGEGGDWHMSLCRAERAFDCKRFLQEVCCCEDDTYLFTRSLMPVLRCRRLGRAVDRTEHCFPSQPLLEAQIARSHHVSCRQVSLT